MGLVALPADWHSVKLVPGFGIASGNYYVAISRCQRSGMNVPLVGVISIAAEQPCLTRTAAAASALIRLISCLAIRNLSFLLRSA